ncbi:MAG TPA: ABC transporter permease subunit [Ignavibacteria bacterium]
MDKILAVTKKELRSSFNSPIAYIIILLFLVVTGWFFTTTIFPTGLVSMRGITENIIIHLVLLIFAAAISMRTFSEEKKSGTLELLLTKPLKDFDIVIGKFLSALLLVVFTFIPTLVYVISFKIFGLGSIDLGSIFGAYLGLIFISALYINIGIFISSLTENQVIAFIISFLIILILFLFNKILVFIPSPLVSTIEYLSSDYHYLNIAKGVIDTRDLVYFISGIYIMLLLTKTSLERRKW